MVNTTFMLWYKCYIFGYQDERKYHTCKKSNNSLFPEIASYILSHYKSNQQFEVQIFFTAYYKMLRNRHWTIHA